MITTLRRSARVVFAALLLACVATQAGAAAEEKFKPFKMKTLEGAQKTLADFSGKATLVVFFFPTCRYCNAEFPEIQRMYDTYKDQGLSMVWINVTPDEDRLVNDWRTKHAYTVPVLLGGRSALNDYKLAITPTQFLLDPQGKVLSKHAGYTKGDEKQFELEIQQAVGAAH